MKRTPVASSQIKSIGYDPTKETLEIEFTRGGGIYEYRNVTQEDYKALMGHGKKIEDGHSIGSYFIRNMRLRPEKFPYRKLEAEKP